MLDAVNKAKQRNTSILHCMCFKSTIHHGMLFISPDLQHTHVFYSFYSKRWMYVPATQLYEVKQKKMPRYHGLRQFLLCLQFQLRVILQEEFPQPWEKDVNLLSLFWHAQFLLILLCLHYKVIDCQVYFSVDVSFMKRQEHLSCSFCHSYLLNLFIKYSWGLEGKPVLCFVFFFIFHVSSQTQNAQKNSDTFFKTIFLFTTHLEELGFI